MYALYEVLLKTPFYLQGTFVSKAKHNTQFAFLLEFNEANARRNPTRFV